MFFFRFDLISVKFEGPGLNVYRMKTTNKPRRKRNFSKDTKVVNAKNGLKQESRCDEGDDQKNEWQSRDELFL